MAGRAAARPARRGAARLHAIAGRARTASAGAADDLGPDPASDASRPDPTVEPDGRIEIVLPDGTAVRVTEAIGAAALRRVLVALRG